MLFFLLYGLNMKLKKTLLALAISIVFMSASASVTPLVFFQQNDPINSLTVSLNGQVKFSQTHTIDPTNNNS